MNTTNGNGYIVRVDIIGTTETAARRALYVEGFDTLVGAAHYARQSARVASKNTYFYVHEIADGIVSTPVSPAIRGEL